MDREYETTQLKVTNELDISSNMYNKESFKQELKNQYQQRAIN